MDDQRTDREGGMMPTGRILRLRQYEDDPNSAYLELFDHPHKAARGIVAKTVSLHELIENYDGPAINLDFNNDGKAIGIEILYPSRDLDEA
jgi:hypothetical protein